MTCIFFFRPSSRILLLIIYKNYLQKEEPNKKFEFAAYLIYYQKNNMLKKKTNQRRIFLHQLSEELAKPIIENRSSNKQIMRHHSTKNAIEDVLGFEFAPAPVVEKETAARDSSGRIKVTGLCYRQTIKRRRKTRKSGAKCDKLVCDKHSSAKILCSDCLE